MDTTVEKPPATRYEALGRVMASLRDCQALNGARHVDWWAAMGGLEWHIEWQDGPYAHEVAGALFDAMTTEDQCSALRDSLTQHEFHATGQNRARFEVLGVPIVLRALEPVGADEAVRRAVHKALHEPV